MAFSAWGGLLRTSLCRSIARPARRPRPPFRCSFSQAVLALESRVLPAATPVGNPIDLDAAGPMAVDADGDFVATWEQTTADQHQSLVEADIMARRYHADGTPDGDAFPVNTITTNFQEHPSIAMNASGEFVIAWSCQVGTYDQVELHAQRFGADGVADGSEFRVDATNSHSIFSAVNLAMYDDGAFVITWDRYGVSNTSDVFVRQYDATGVALGGESLVSSGNFIASPDVAITPDGGFVLAWTDDGVLGGQRFDANGQVVGSAFDASFEHALQPSIATDAEGNLVVAWSQNTNGWADPQAYARRFSAAGVALGDAFPVSNDPAPDEGSPIVAMTPDGNFVIAWSKGPSFPDHQVVARAFNSEGVPLGNELSVDPNVEDNQALGGFAMTATGEFIVNWTDRDTSESKAQRYLLNLAPTDITLSPGSVPENAPTGSSVGTLTAIDADGDDTFVYELVSGAGGDDNGAFHVDGNELKTAAVFDYESKHSYTVRVRATDLAGASVEKTLTIQVTNVFEPEVVTLAGDAVSENLPKGTLVGTLGLTDAPDGSIRYRLVGGSGKFRISGNRLLTNARFNFEKQSSYSIRVQARDSSGHVTVQTFTIEINDVNEGPTGISLDWIFNGPKRPGATVGRLTATDPDPLDHLQFSLVPGAADNSLFEIRGNRLKTRVRIDPEVQSTFTVRVRVTGEDGSWIEDDFTVTIA